jgi:aryl-alcohol dehydrogenase-like predicted oxidoreductase
MRYNTLGRTGLKVSELGLGCMTFGPGVGFMKGISVSERRAYRIIDRAVEAGINLLDLADVYQDGASEEIVGNWLGRRHLRDQLVIATKVRDRTGEGPNGEGLSRGHIFEACEASLQRLHTDYIDLYQVHWPDVETPLEETLAALTELQRQGKIRYAGCSNFAAWYLAKALRISEGRNLVRFESVQPQYNLLVRHVERELLPLCRDESIAVLPWSPLASGLLSGKYERGEPIDHPRLSVWLRRHAGGGEPQIWHTLTALKAVADARGVPPATAALSWLRRRPGVTSCIIGVRTQEQLAEDLAAVGLELDEEHTARLDAVSAPGPDYPSDMMNRMLAGLPAWE